MGYRDAMSTSAPPADPRNELHRLVEVQAALRRVATLVASGAPSAEVLSVVAQEVAQVMHLPMVGVYRYDSDGLMTVIATVSDRPHVLQPGTRWPLDGQSMVAQVQRTGRPARVEDYTDLPGALAAGARESGLNATAGAPMQAALRRVATLVAAGAPPAEVFEAVSVEVAALIGADGSALKRYEADGTVTALSSWTPEGGYSNLGTHHALEGTVSGLIFETGRPGRINYEEAPAGGPETARERGVHSSVGAPITVQGRLWGVLVVFTNSKQPLPRDTEQRLAEFAELFATAIANSEAHEQLAQLADEQAALRRVATLVAEGATPHRVFDAVQHEVVRMFNAPLSVLLRYDDANGTATLVASDDGFLGPIGRTWSVENDGRGP